MAVSLSQYCIACTRVIERIPPAATLAITTSTDEQAAHPGRRPRHDAQREPGPLQLGQQVEPPDADHEQRGQPADRVLSSRASAKSGRV